VLDRALPGERVPDRVVYVVAKAPRVGSAKTRLCPPLTPEQAAQLYRGFLLDSLELAARVRYATVRVICPDSGMAEELAAIIPPGCDLVAQAEPGLGAALEECFRSGLADGHEAVAVIASDNPTLPSDLIEQAFDRLAQHDVVLGPTEDGGYYLVAARAVHPSLFRDMAWSNETVLEETLRRCETAGLRADQVRRWYDVDTPEALAELARRLESLPRDCAVHTRAALLSAALPELPAPSPRPLRTALIIPVLNEAGVIGRVLDEVPRASVDRVLVVDGGSTDDTRAVAAAHGAEVVRRDERGYGAACWGGVQEAQDCDLLVFLDGDYSDPPADIERLLEPLRAGTADLVLGCRDFAPGALPLHARLGNRLVLALIRLLVGRSFADLPSYKAIRSDRLAELAMQERTYGWTTEMVVKAARRGFRIAEIRVGYRERGGGRSKVSGTIRGTLGAGYKLITTAVRCARAPLPGQPAGRT
jgi:rSAM/selenodomain-associated transferase 1